MTEPTTLSMYLRMKSACRREREEGPKGESAFDPTDPLVARMDALDLLKQVTAVATGLEDDKPIAAKAIKRAADDLSKRLTKYFDAVIERGAAPASV